MNSIAWPDDPTIEDIPDRLVEICRKSDGNTGMLANEIYHVLHGYDTVHEIDGDNVRYTGPHHTGEEGAIIQMAYHSDARRIVEIVEEADEDD